ncbi:MAG: TonB-dependent receptor, partial [Flavobacteriales bacterium]|nr:TonB-dependent receptor [Flavobacteriales bacterium]
MIRGQALVLFFLFLGLSAAGQTVSTLSGRVVDAVSHGALPGATVQVHVADTSYGSTANVHGAFRFEALPTGIHRVVASYVGYAAVEIPEVWVRLGKDEFVELALVRAPNELREVEVRSAGPSRMESCSMHTLTVEQSLRYPATFFDPARLAMNYAGVAGTNDQANHFSVRGNGPASNAWMLEGAEIVDPNHLTNAGTASDLPTLSGGGTTILSAQMLGTSRLLTGAFPTSYGNALGGIMDLRLRPGSNTRRAYTGQAGLLGIDLSAEGPFKVGGKASYLVNYRYSTLGLLSAMGVQLGEEDITFQDLSFNVSLPMGKSLLTVFGMGGNSSNRFDAKDSAEWKYDKDSRNIDYTAKVGAAGATFRLPLGSNAVWSSTAVISANDQERTVEDLAFSGFTFRDTALLYERKSSMVSHVQGAVGSRATFRVGGSAMERDLRKRLYGISDTTTAWLLRPCAQFGYAITERLHTEVGVAYSKYTANGSDALEPRFTIRNNFRKGWMSLAMGQRAQLPQVQFFPWEGTLFTDANGTVVRRVDNSGIGLTRSQEIVLAYEHAFKPYLVLHIEVYYQQLRDVPVGNPLGFSPNAFGESIVNTWEGITWPILEQLGEATNQGIEISFDHRFHRNFFYQVNATLLDARFTDIQGGLYNSRWNTSGMSNVVLGREWVKEKEGGKRTWGVNGRLNVVGGQRHTPSDDRFSSGPEPFSAQYDTYHRVDLRVYLKRERKGHTGMWAVDLQNVANAQNEAYVYYDRRQNAEIT